jgi:hypothetical protein
MMNRVAFLFVNLFMKIKLLKLLVVLQFETTGAHLPNWQHFHSIQAGD